MIQYDPEYYNTKIVPIPCPYHKGECSCPFRSIKSPTRKKMPKALHDKLEKQANKKGLKGKRKQAYIYGTLNKKK